MEKSIDSLNLKQKSAKSPPFLEKGDMIGVTCPASKIGRKEAQYGCEVLQSWGFDVRMGETLKGHFHNFSASDEQRVNELQQMLDDKNMKAIVFGRGGYGVLRILDQLDFSAFKKYPKWICGYSDITALHLHIFKHCGIQTLHSLMVGGITAQTKNDKYVKSLKNALSGFPAAYPFNKNKRNRKGIAKGQLIGGNLSLLSALCGSQSVPDMKGKLLFLEDIGEYKYLIDRMMITLKRAGWLDELAGLLVGGFSNSKDTEEPFGSSEFELIYEKVKEYDYPVAFGFPVGHQKENYALKEGAVYELIVSLDCTLNEIS